MHLLIHALVIPFHTLFHNHTCPIYVRLVITVLHSNTPVRADIKRLHSYWSTTYDWRSTETKLNRLPHFKTHIPVDGFGELDIHFLHQKSEVKGAIPLLFVHGWPGSWMEVTKMLPLLKGVDGKPAFHVVAPSLPNYVFSESVRKVSWNPSWNDNRVRGRGYRGLEMGSFLLFEMC